MPVVFTETERLRTGRMIKDHSLILFSKKLDLIRRKNRFSEYTTEETRKKLTISEDLVFPFEWVVVTRYEVTSVQASIRGNRCQGEKEAAEEAYKEALELVPEGAEIIEENIYFTEEDGEAGQHRAILECVEDIGLSRRIGGN